MGFDLGIWLAIGFVVALIITSLVMWYVRSNETYEDLLPPEEADTEESQDGVKNV